MNEFAAALQFFEGFGENWYALSDCLECLDEWLPADAYILVIERAEEVLLESGPESLAALMVTLNEVGESFSKPIEDNDRFNRKAIPFHVLLNLSDLPPRKWTHQIRRDAPGCPHGTKEEKEFHSGAEG